MAGDHITAIAIPVLAVTVLHAGAEEMGVLTAAGQLPLLLFGLLAGAWVDRVRRRRLLIGCDLARAALIVLIPVIYIADALTMPLLISVAFAAAALGVAFNMAAVAFLPSLVARDNLIEANTRITQTRAVGQIAGPGLAGVVVQTLTAPIAILLDAGSYVLSAVLLRRTGLNDPKTTEQHHPKLATAVIEGLKYVWANGLLRPSAACAATYNLFNAAFVALQILYLSRHLQLNATEIGLVLAAIGPGALVGSALAITASRRLGIGFTMIAGLLITSLANVAVPLAAGPHVLMLAMLMAAMFLNGFGQPLYNINQGSLRQAIVPLPMQGRVQATLAVLASGAAPLGALAGGFLGARLGEQSALLIAAAGTTLACGWLICSPIRTQKELPSTETTTAPDQPTAA